ncbi:MAG: MotA/TolQ/ExbB proton channel family protein [Planctomycetes bacterium]|nr:MotA/TolQ/ExbB proton channel family protein [Planctomycetota bacterium]
MHTIRYAALTLIGWLALAAPLAAQTPEAQRQVEDDVNSFSGIILAGGSVGAVIILLSIVAVGLAIDYLRTLRQPVLMPRALVEQVWQLAQQGQIAEALQVCHNDRSCLAIVLEAGLRHADEGWPAIEKGMEDALAEQAGKLYRRIEYLSVIGNIAPMLGLLGTVVGMVFAFRVVATTQGAARAADLAEGIYKALITTVEGLVVAIPALGLFAMFRSRVENMLGQLASTAQQTLAPLRAPRPAPRRTAPVAPPVEGR